MLSRRMVGKKGKCSRCCDPCQAFHCCSVVSLQALGELGSTPAYNPQALLAATSLASKQHSAHTPSALIFSEIGDCVLRPEPDPSCVTAGCVGVCVCVCCRSVFLEPRAGVPIVTRELRSCGSMNLRLDLGC